MEGDREWVAVVGEDRKTKKMNAVLKRICYDLHWPLENADAPSFYCTVSVKWGVSVRDGERCSDDRVTEDAISLLKNTHYIIHAKAKSAESKKRNTV